MRKKAGSVLVNFRNRPGEEGLHRGESGIEG
jgi:hypothetical protein